MLLPKQHIPFLLLFPDQFDRQYHQAKDKDQQADTVDAMHIPYPFVFWPVGIFLFKVEVFRDLIPDAHGSFFFPKVTGTLIKKEKPWKNPGPFT